MNIGAGDRFLSWVVALGVTLLAFVCYLGAASAAQADYAFDAGLSLTGNCSTSAADPVPDPGVCPIPPGVPGVDHPTAPFTRPEGFAVDDFGNMYVSSYGKSSAGGKEGRVDVFDSDGFFVSELKIENGPKALAVDSAGNLYVHEGPLFSGGEQRVSRYSPSGEYKPEEGKITYGSGVIVADENGPPASMPSTTGIAIDPANDHLYIHYGGRIAEFGSAVESNPLLDSTTGEGTLEFGKWVAVDAARGRIYASDSKTPDLLPSYVRVFELGGTHDLLETIEGCPLRGEDFGASQGDLQLAVDEETGDLLVGDLAARARVYRFNEDYECEEVITHSFQDAGPSAIAVDNSSTSPNQGHLFVTSGESGIGHSYAFEPQEIAPPPNIDSAAAGEVAETEAELRAQIDAGGKDTHYVFEYTTTADTGFAEAKVAGEGDLAPGAENAVVSARASGLAPGGSYRFRVKAQSGAGADEAEGTFGTYPVLSLSPCPNDALRTGGSVALPDCRAYELVTPADTNGHVPGGARNSGVFFSPTVHSSPQGDKASFIIEGGSLPGFEASGSFNGDNYTATRTASGWQTEYAGPNGAESMSPSPGSVSPDQRYSFWRTSLGDEGSAAVNGEETTYVRYPDGHSALIGRGSLQDDPKVRGNRITENGTHIIFTTMTEGNSIPLRLEESAPPNGTAAVYDRTADEVTHVVSLLPGEVTPADGEDAGFLGTSDNGAGIAFSIGSATYLRLNNQESFKVAEAAKFAGVRRSGTRAFYVKGGNLFAFDATTETTIPFTSIGDATVVNVADGGTRAYFVSPSVLAGANPEGDLPEAGERNLYLSEEGAISFVGTVTDQDVEGKPSNPSRTNPDGRVFVFASRANLTEFDSAGKAQIYRYDSTANRLQCLSCNPTGLPPLTDSSLQSFSEGSFTKPPFTAVAFVPNLRADGKRAFFQSSEPLVASDGDKRQDVYEWEEQGVGSCNRPEGCVYLISSPNSAEDEYLYALSDSGNDVFFVSGDQLVARDTGATASIYDARVGGGFAEPSEEICNGEGCRPTLNPAPVLSAPVSGATGPSGNAAPSKPKKCPKAKHKVKRHGKVICVKKKKPHQKNHERKANQSGRAGR
jgi:hypothetical protein